MTRLILGIATTVAIGTLSAGVQAQTPAAPSASSPSPATAQTTAAAPAAPQTSAMDESRRVTADEIDKLLEAGKVLVLDVREPKEIAELGTIEDSVNIPIGQLEKRLGELPKDRLILTAWNGGGRAARAAALLEKNGYKTVGFCGLKDYKGKKKVAPTSAPATPPQ